MATHAVGASASDRSMPLTTYTRFARVCALLAGLSAFGYAVAFIVLRNPLLSALFLLLFGLLATVPLVDIYERVRHTDAAFALWAVVLSLGGAFGTAIHAGYDLANVLNPPAAALPDLPNAIDPRGLLAFGVAGIGLFVLAWLMGRSGLFPRGLSYLGMASGVLLILLYLGRLIVLNAASPLILVPAIVNGFVLTPVWYLWLSSVMWRRQAT